MLIYPFNIHNSDSYIVKSTQILHYILFGRKNLMSKNDISMIRHVCTMYIIMRSVSHRVVNGFLKGFENCRETSGWSEATMQYQI